MIVSESNYLAHHGVLGMKWGVRRTPEQLGHRVKNKLENNRRVDRLADKNKQKGMSSEEARTKAKKRVKTEAAVIGGAALGIAARKAHLHVSRNYIDKTLKAGTKFKTITTKPEQEMSRVYAAYKKRDIHKYKGLYGQQLKNTGYKDIYRVTRSASKNVKVASKKNASKAFLDLYKNDEAFRKEFLEAADAAQWAGLFGAGAKKQLKLYQKVGKGAKMTDKELLTTGYDFFNTNLVNWSSKNNQKFYDKLKKLGYSAIEDVNDIAYSGYGSKSPVIIFDMESVVTKSVDKLSEQSLRNSGKIENSIAVGKQLLGPIMSQGAAVYGANAAVETVLPSSKRKAGDS